MRRDDEEVILEDSESSKFLGATFTRHMQQKSTTTSGD